MRSVIRLSSLALTCALLAGCGDGERATAPREEPARARAQVPIYGATGADNLRVVPVEVDVVEIPPGWSGMRIAVLSDFHLGMWEGNVTAARVAAERAVRERPDLVVLLGDYLGRGTDDALLDHVLEPLRERRVLAVLGDRDMVERPEGPDTLAARTRQALERNGVEVLMNARARVVRGGDTAFVAGIDPFTARRPDWRRAEIWNGIPAGPSTVIVLSHMPVSAAVMPTGRYPVMLAGHTFCGVVEVPGTPRLRWVNTTVFPGTAEPERTRIHRIRGATLFVTCGVGFNFVPVRFGAPPELAMVTLRGVGIEADTVPGQAVDVDSLIRQFTPEPRPREAPADTAAQEEPAEEP
jgi:uncharacterized protein